MVANDQVSGLLHCLTNNILVTFPKDGQTFFPSLSGFQDHQYVSLKNTECHNSSEYNCFEKTG